MACEDILFVSIINPASPTKLYCFFVLIFFIEGVYNAVDAKCTFCRVTLDKDNFYCSVEDDGEGIDTETFAAIGESVIRNESKNMQYGFHGISVLALVTLSSSVRITSSVNKNEKSHMVKEFVAGQVAQRPSNQPSIKKYTRTGTVVTLKNVFGQWPVRQKTLTSKSGGMTKEVERLRKMMQFLAYAHCRKISFSLILKRPDQSISALLHTPRTSNISDILSSFLGISQEQNTHTLIESTPALTMTLQLVSPHDWAHSKKLQFISIDGAWTKEMQLITTALSRSILCLKRMCDRKLKPNEVGEVAESRTKAIQKQGHPQFLLEICSSGKVERENGNLQTLSSVVVEMLYSSMLKICFQHLMKKVFPTVPFGVVHWVCEQALPNTNDATTNSRYSRPNSFWMRSKIVQPNNRQQSGIVASAASLGESLMKEVDDGDAAFDEFDFHSDDLCGDFENLMPAFDETFFETFSPHQRSRLCWRLDESFQSENNTRRTEKSSPFQNMTIENTAEIKYMFFDNVYGEQEDAPMKPEVGSRPHNEEHQMISTANAQTESQIKLPDDVNTRALTSYFCPEGVTRDTVEESSLMNSALHTFETREIHNSETAEAKGRDAKEENVPARIAKPTSSASESVPIRLKETIIKVKGQPVHSSKKRGRKESAQELKLHKFMIKDAVVLQQISNKFILLKYKNILLAVDQHAADERVQLEAIEKRVFRDGDTSFFRENARLLSPSANTITITADEISIFEKHKPNLRQWGFEFEIKRTVEEQNLHSSSSFVTPFLKSLKPFASDHSTLTGIYAPTVFGVILRLKNIYLDSSHYS
jgi:DNA mismatch repair ATPase MutL